MERRAVQGRSDSRDAAALWSSSGVGPLHPFLLACLAALLTLVSGHVAAQGDEASRRSISPVDSAEVRQAAEYRVRDYLREVGGQGGVAVSGGLRPPVDVVEEARARLIGELDRLAREIPGDDWIMGQRVAFRIQQGPVEDAVRVAAGCRASSWWCDALRGFTLHVARDFDGAHRAFDRALDTMPLEERCTWREALRPLLHGSLGRRYGGANCLERDELAEQIWWVAHPFHLHPWNDRRSEHYTRFVGVLLYAQGRGAAGSRCGADCGRMALFRGWPPGWWGPERPTLFPDGPGYRFLPPPDVGLHPLQSRASDWDLVDDEYHERYDPPYGPVHDLDQQTAFLRRGDSILVLAATELDRHVLRGVWSLEVGIVLSRSPDDERRVARTEGPPDRTVLQMRAPLDHYLVSVEAIAERSGAARARFGHRLPESSESGVTTSDLVLFDWTGEPRDDLDVMLPQMLGTDRLAPGREVGAFWEVYGADPGDELHVSVAARPEDVGFLRRVGEALRVVGRAEAMRVTWTENAAREGLEGRSLHLDLSGLEPGRYVLELSVRREGEEPTVVRRPIEMRAF